MSHAPPIVTSLLIGAAAGLLAWWVDATLRGRSVHAAVFVVLAVLVAGLWYERLTRSTDDARGR